MNYDKKKNLLIFERFELKNLIECSYENLLLEIIYRYKLKPLDDINKLWKIINAERSLKKLSRDRDEHEVFTATIIADFYGEKCKICFEMDEKFNPDKNALSTLDDLNQYRKINSIVDFGIIRKNNELSLFQLKRYREDLNSKCLLRFIKKILQGYCNNIGDVNLLIILQSPGTGISSDIFEELHYELIKCNFCFNGHILISFNANNKLSVIKTVFPKLGTSIMPINWNYPELIQI